MISSILKLGALLAALLSVLIGLVFCSTIVTRTGFYRWLAETHYPAYIGFSPAQHYGMDWKYSFEDLYRSNLTGQTARVTGANSGIGYELALALARLGAEVTLACRNPTKCHAAAETIRGDPRVKNGAKVSTGTLDTNSLASVQRFALDYQQEHSSLDILFLNAGIVYAAKGVRCNPINDDGIEEVFATNYVGHHLLYRLLEDLLEQSNLPRVVQTSSSASFQSYETYAVATDLETLNRCKKPAEAEHHVWYGHSKLAQIVWTKKLARLDSRIYANAFHPGAVDTKVWSKVVEESQAPPIIRRLVEWMQREVMWSGAEGALTGLFLAVDTAALKKQDIRGRYYHPMAQEVVNPRALDEELQDRLWEFSEELVKEYLPAPVENADDDKTAPEDAGNEEAGSKDVPESESHEETAEAETTTHEDATPQAESHVSPDEEGNGEKVEAAES